MQNDDKNKQDQINKMDNVFRGSFVTIATVLAAWSIKMCRSNKVNRFKGYGLVFLEVEGRPDTFTRVGLLIILDLDWFKCPAKILPLSKTSGGACHGISTVE
ncbi:hypothetical protein BKA56DRAFT_650252 [Ilyonectria sp. MPI-CAGE-AT-0026]|nr:hypothetical protein BKA56DRAFT_650252 [Ilyonectria sp. MPI-CAGE-AT-0026]